MTEKERRRFFRIDDTVAIKTETIPPNQLDDRLNNFWTNHHEFSIRNEFNHKLDQHAADLIAIKNQHPSIARYLTVLQKQVDLLSENILPDDALNGSSERSVNISAQGISFLSTEAISKGEVVEISLQLLPKKQRIVVFAKIIRCDKADDFQYKLTVDFEHIHEADREILIKHIHGQQLKSLGAARFDADQSD